MGRWGRGGLVIPPDLAVAVGGIDGGWSFGRCSYVVTVAATGPARLTFAMDEPAGPTWLRHAPVRKGRRRRALRTVLASGALHGPVAPQTGQAGIGAGAGWTGGPGHADHDLNGAAGWLHVATGGWSVRTPVGPDGRLRGVPVLAAVTCLVPEPVWREMYTLRQQAWDEWVNRARPVPGFTGDQTRADESQSGDVLVAGGAGLGVDDLHLELPPVGPAGNGWPAPGPAPDPAPGPAPAPAWGPSPGYARGPAVWRDDGRGGVW